MSGQQSQINAGGDNGQGDNSAEFDAGQVSINSAGTDDLLDEIDGLLESNAEEFVRSYVQKGGE